VATVIGSDTHSAFAICVPQFIVSTKSVVPPGKTQRLSLPRGCAFTVMYVLLQY
jgi:hypothetical protein